MTIGNRENVASLDRFMPEIESGEPLQLAVCVDKNSTENLQCIPQQSKSAQHTHGYIMAVCVRMILRLKN